MFKISRLDWANLKTLKKVLLRKEACAFLPAIILSALWFGVFGAILIIAIAFPVMLFVLNDRAKAGPAALGGGVAKHVTRDVFAQRLQSTCDAARSSGRNTICLALEMDDYSEIRRRMGRSAAEEALRVTANRINDAVRGGDQMVRLEGTTLALALAPKRRINLDTTLQVTERIQNAVNEPLRIDATTIYVTVSIGYCLSNRAPRPGGASLLSAAETALEEARRNGSGSVRGYSSEMQQSIRTRNALVEDVLNAFDEGQIKPWFQPQISTDTGDITGIEALARWCHPERGMIPPADFLPAIESAGLMEQLSEAMLHQSLSALASWDRSGLRVPTVAVNFSGAELRNPKLVDRIKWELDRFNLPPERLTIEVLETVIATSDDDIVTRNIAALSNMGCQIDLDDFGTGHASISTIKRFAVNRIKIDRSFVTRVHEDSEQQKLVSAILQMAEKMEFDTLAEGVEELGEHAMLAQLGCGHVQGFGIARPMPFEDTIGWMNRHNEKLAKPLLAIKAAR